MTKLGLGHLPRGSPLGLDMLLAWASVSVGKTVGSVGNSAQGSVSTQQLILLARIAL